MNKSTDIVFNILQTMLANSPKASYKRLNPALRVTLRECISADLPFQPDTFNRIFNELRGNWWFGDGQGSHIGEWFYNHACECNHASAIQSFEQFAERPGVLWEENIKTPERLHVGSKFSWKGYYVTVTSMRAESLVACTYKNVPHVRGIQIGATLSDYSAGDDDRDYVITSCKRTGNKVTLQAVKTESDAGSSDIAKRFTITYAEIAEFRRTEKERVKKIIAKIAECDPKKDADSLNKQIAAEHFRHFQLEEIQTAFKKRKDWVENQGRIEAWRKGERDAWVDSKEILVRVNGDRVECSNGNRVSLVAVQRLLPVVMARRNETANIGLLLDGFTISNVSPKGVRIGCTLVPWPEVERLDNTLKTNSVPA